MSLVWERAPYTAGSLLVFLALADWSNDDGICWPSIPKIADKTRLEKRSIQYIIRTLKKDGMIEIEEGRGRGHQHRYTIKVQNLRLLPNLIREDAEEKMQSVAPNEEIKGEIHDIEKVQCEAEKAKSTTQKVQPIAPDPLEEPLVDPSDKPSIKTSVDFWESLKNNPAYAHIDIDLEIHRMRAWLVEHPDRRMTRRFAINWLNKKERPLSLPESRNGNGKDRATREAELKRRMGWDKLERTEPTITE